MKRLCGLAILFTILIVSIGGFPIQYEEFLTGSEALHRFQQEVVPLLIQIARDENIAEILHERGETTPLYDVMAFVYQEAIKRINTRSSFFVSPPQTELMIPPGGYIEQLRAEIILQFCFWSFIPWCAKEPPMQELAEEVRTKLMVGALERLLLNLAFEDKFFELRPVEVVEWAGARYQLYTSNYIDAEAFQQVLTEIEEEFKQSFAD